MRKISKEQRFPKNKIWGENVKRIVTSFGKRLGRDSICPGMPCMFYGEFRCDHELAI